MAIAPDMNSVFAAVARRKYIPVGSAPASSAMDGANADHAGAFFGHAGDGHCNKHQIHVLRVSGTVMIDKLRAASLKLQWLQPIAMVLAIAALGVFVYVIFGAAGIAKDDYYLIPSAVILLWCLLICAILYGFPHVPERASKELGVFKRLAISALRFYFTILALTCLATTIAVAVVTFKILNIWLKNYS